MAQNALAHGGAQPQKATRYASLWNAEYFTGLYTNRSIFLDGGSRIERLYLGPRGDALTSDSLNTEVSTRLTMIRRPGSSVFNSQTWNAPNSFYSFRTFGQANNTESIKVMVDQSDAIYTASNNQKVNIWNKAAGSGQTYFQSVADILYMGDGAEQIKWINSRQSWSPNSIYSDTYPGAGTLTDFIVDPNGNLQVAVGGFNLLISEVQVVSNVLTLTLDTAQLADPAGTPTGVASTTGGTLPAGNYYARIVGIDAFGNPTEAGSESAAVVTTGTTGSIVWSWTPVSGVSSYRIYVGTTSGGENTYFTQTQQFYVTAPTFTQTVAAGTSGIPPVANSTVVDVPSNLYRMTNVELALSGLTTATFLNGHTITLTGIFPGGSSSNQVTANFTHGNYGPAPDTGVATSGTGITGSTQPTWSKVLNAVTQDSGSQWINRGYAVETWGLAAPVNAPSVFQSVLPNNYQTWAANTFYWPSRFIIEGSYLQQLTTGGTIGASSPTWNNTTGGTTTDGTAVWTCQGASAWASLTPYAKTAYTTYNTGGTYYVYQSLNAGVSGGSQSSWGPSATQGAQVVDGNITWVCLGTTLTWPTFGASSMLSDANVILDSNGFLEQVQDPGGFTTTIPPVWGNTGASVQSQQLAAITAYSVTSGLATITANQDYVPGNEATITNVGTPSGLNGIWPIQSQTGSTFTFYAPLPNGSGSTTGTASSAYGATWTNIGPYNPAATGAKQYGYAFQNSIDDTISNMSPASIKIMALQGNAVLVSGLGSPDLQTDTVVIYATDQGGDTFYQLDTIANPGPGLQWSYTDTTVDAGLNIELEAAVNGQNTPPPAGIIGLTYHLSRIFGYVGNTVYWSSGPDTPAGNGLNGFNPLNYAIFPSAVQRLVPLSTGLLVFTTSDIYLIYGSATTNSPLTPYPYALGYGLGNYNALDITGGVIYFYTTDSQIMSLDPNNGLSEVGFPIADQFLNNPWSPLTAYITWHIGGTKDKALFVSDGVGDWFRMCATPAPETGLTWSPKATVTGGAKCVQSVETSPGVHQLLIGPSGPGPILFRDWTTYADQEEAYPAYFTIGSLVLAHPGQVAELAYFTFDSIKVGKPLVPSVRIDEISGPYERMPRFVPDPPQLVTSRTLYSNRHYFAQTNRPALCRHLQLKVSWEVEAVANELLSSTLYGGFSAEK